MITSDFANFAFVTRDVWISSVRYNSHSIACASKYVRFHVKMLAQSLHSLVHLSQSSNEPIWLSLSLHLNEHRQSQIFFTVCCRFDFRRLCTSTIDDIPISMRENSSQTMETRMKAWSDETRRNEILGCSVLRCDAQKLTFKRRFSLESSLFSLDVYRSHAALRHILTYERIHNSVDGNNSTDSNAIVNN